MGKRIERFVSWALIGALVVQPTLIHAQSIQVVGPDNGPRPHVDQSYNGSPVINIGTPNGSGVSHDIYTEFTADDLILNNSATNVDTQLGGWVEGNPNLAPGQAADLWIGEVVGGNQTQLNGILEVAGPSMDVVLANEFGITCNGCGFINTGRATLTTGTPRFGSDGSLSGFDVKQGLVTIGSGGLDPESRLSLADTSRVDVIARAAAIYGAMRADQLNVVTGANIVNYNWSYDAETGAVTGITEQVGTGTAPALAVDVAALGGMYANSIQMVATENGVGVRLNGEMASSTNIALRADGQLTLGAPAGGRVPQIKAKERVIVRNQGPLLLEGSITSENDNLIDIRTSSGTLTFTGQADGGAITLESAGLANISAAISATDALKVASLTDSVTLGGGSELSAASIDVDAMISAALNGKATATGAITADAGTALTAGAASELSAATITLNGQNVAVAGIATATDTLVVTSGTGGLDNSGTLSAQTATLTSDSTIGNTGIVSAGTSLTVQAATTLTNAATLISGNDLAIYADQILNNGGVIWANDNVTLAANAALDRASLVQNTNGRIEAFQGDLTIRGDEVANLGTAPTIGASEIIKWLEQGSSGPIAPVDELSKLIDAAYLDANGNILPAYSAQYAALWADVINGGGALSSAAQSILKSTVTTPSGTAIKSDFVGLWEDMFAKANADGTPDPAALVMSMVDPAIFDVGGAVLPAYADAYAALWVTLASGGTSVSDAVKGILDPSALVVESTTTDPLTGVVTTTYSNNLESANTDVWAAMSAGSGASYDIVKILYQDRFNDDGVLAEMIAGGTVDIEADEVRSIFGNISAGGDILISANTVTNQAIGASQVLLEVHKKPGCFTCHEGEVDFYDTFGGRIEAIGNVSIVGSLTNVTLNSSELSLQDVMDEMNVYLAEQQAAGDADLAGVPAVRSNNLEFHGDHRSNDFTAPVDGVAEADRVVIPVDTGTQTVVAVATTATPTLTPTASVDALLAAGLNTVAETNTEFTDYANFITSNYMMDVDRLQYRDNLVINTSEIILAALNKADVITADVGNLDYLNQPIEIPSRDGSGLTTIYPAATNFELDPRGALISGTNVTISGDAINNSGAILASVDASITGNTITGTGGSIVADSGEVALTALGRIEFEDVKIDGSSVDIIAGQDFVGKSVAISSETDTSIFAVTGVTLTSSTNEYALNNGRGASLTAIEQVQSTLTTGGDLSIISSADLELAGVVGNIGGRTTLSAGGDLLLTVVQSEVEVHSGNSKNGTDIHNVTSLVTTLNTGGDFVATAGGSAILVGTQIDVGGSVQLSAAEDVVLAAAQDIKTFETRKSKKRFFGLSKSSSSQSTTKVTNEGVRIAASGDVDVIAETGDLTTAGTSFVSNNGDINLSAVEGDIYAGTYTDIFQEEVKKSKSFLFGLISSSSTLNTVDRFNTGTEALASLDLSLVSGADTTLVGATLSAGRNLNINTGGDFSVQAAIDSQRSEFFSSNMGLITMTTIQERSFVETAVFTQLLAGQALNFGIGGQAELAVYEQAGVDAPNLEDLYPEELLTLAGLNLLTQDLANEYFYDEQTSLSPAFKALVGVALSFTGVGAAIGQSLLGTLGVTGAYTGSFALGTLEAASWLGNAATAFSSSALIGTLDGAVSGNFDLGAILEGAVFSGITAGLTASINLSDIIGDIPVDSPLNTALLGAFGDGNLTIGSILEGALDGAISSGLSSAVYGTDFGEGFSTALLNTVVNLTLADVQYEIGDLGVIRDENGEIISTNEDWEGSLPHALLHGLAGCAAAEATGADCAAGAAGAVAQSFYAGSLGNLDAEAREQLLDNAELIGALAAFAFSGGEASNVTIGAVIARSAFDNNFLYHAEAQAKANAEQGIADCEDGGRDCTEAEVAALQALVDEYQAIDQARDAMLAYACQNPISQLCIASVSAARVAGGSYLGEPDRNELADDWMNAARAGSGSGPAWDPAAFGVGLGAGALLGVNALMGAAVVREAARMCGSRPACTAAVVAQVIGAEVITEFAGGAVVVTALDGTILRRIDLNPPSLTVSNIGRHTGRRTQISANMDTATQRSLHRGPDIDLPATNRGEGLANPGTRPGATDAEAGGASYYDQYRKADGSGWDWPENLGFAGTPTDATMPVGTRLDRYGSADGSFMSPAGTPLEQRAMAPGSAAEPLRTYEVVKPLPVIQGEVAPAFGQSGGGTQMLPNLSERVNVDWLVRNGYLKEVN